MLWTDTRTDVNQYTPSPDGGGYENIGSLIKILLMF